MFLAANNAAMTILHITVQDPPKNMVVMNNANILVINTDITKFINIDLKTLPAY